MWSYKKRLRADVQRWKASGWLTDDGAANIDRELARSGREVGLASALGILASVLLGLAAMSFVAAHWAEIPRLARLVLLAILMWSGYAAAGVLAQRGARAFADAAILFAVAIFGASIMLVSQMFHIEGHAPDAVALWGAGALLSGVVLRSNPALAFALILAVVWWGMEAAEHTGVRWAFLIGWGAVTAAFVWQRWAPGLHLSALALAAFIVSLGFILNRGHAHEIVVVIGLLGLAIAYGVEKMRPELSSEAEAVAGYALGVAGAGLFALQFFESPSWTALGALAALTLALLVATITYAMTTHRNVLLWLGYAGFSIEVLALYTKTVGTILGTSLFFLVAGLLVAGLAALAWRLAKGSADGAEAAA